MKSVKVSIDSLRTEMKLCDGMLEQVMLANSNRLEQMIIVNSEKLEERVDANSERLEQMISLTGQRLQKIVRAGDEKIGSYKRHQVISNQSNHRRGMWLFRRRIYF